MNSTEWDAMQLLSKVADEYRSPLVKTPHKSIRLSTIATHHPQTGHSEPYTFARPERLHSNSSVDLSRDSDEEDAIDLSDMSYLSQLFFDSEATLAYSRYLSDVDERNYIAERAINLEHLSPNELMRALSLGSPLDRLITVARTELKRTGWFERRDKWSILDSGLSDPGTPVSRYTLSPDRSIDSRSPTTPITPALTISIPRNTTSPLFIPESGCDSNEPSFNYHREPDVFDGDIRDASGHLHYNSLPHLPQLKSLGRVKMFVKNVISSSGANTAEATARMKNSVLRTPPPGPTTAPHSASIWTATWTPLSFRGSPTYGQTIRGPWLD